MGRRRRTFALLLAGALVAAAVLGGMSAFTGGASAATGGNFVATGHDMDLHCAFSDADECNYFKILVDKVRAGSALPILALDQGTEVPDALTAMGESPVVTVDPSDATAFNATAFTSGSTPLYSAIITASDDTCGGCDNNDVGEASINARAADFATFFNNGGGIIALAGAERRDTYYNFVPLGGLSAVAVSEPFTVTPAGAALGVTDAMVNCCPTHNSFATPPAPLQVLETDSAGFAETIAAFGATINCGATTTTTSGQCTFETTSTTTTTMGGNSSSSSSTSPSTSAPSSSTSTSTTTSTSTSTSTSTTTSTSTSTSTTSTSTSTTIAAPVTTTIPTAACKPGWGYGDKNHCHSGPPGLVAKGDPPAHGIVARAIDLVRPDRGNGILGFALVTLLLTVVTLVLSRRRRA